MKQNPLPGGTTAPDNATQLAAIAQTLSESLANLDWGSAVHYCYNPLEYAWSPFMQYLSRYGNATRRILFLGMNPGPFGMAQTGIPFGSIPAVRDWMQLDGSQIGRPATEHPKRPIEGFACHREETSGKRLWGLFQQRCGSADQFFTNHFVLNWCPLIFLSASGANLTPDKLPKSSLRVLEAHCDAALTRSIAILEPAALIGVGRFASLRLQSLQLPIPLVTIPHPSPANPQANRNWPQAVTAIMEQSGLWQP